MRRIGAVFAALGLFIAAIAVVTADSHTGGVGNIRDDAGLSDKITAQLVGFADPGDAAALEGWLVSDDGSVKLSIGIADLDADGNSTLEFTSPAGQNLINEYNQLVITEEPVPDDDPGPSSIVVASDMIPTGSMTHIRHVMSVWPASADGGGLGVGARREIGVARLHAELSKAAADDGDVDGAKQHAEHVVNILEGSGGENFGDLDGNGTAQNPGDGFGALLYAADAGKHAGFAAAADDADAEVLLHGQHVVDCQANVGTWGTGARDKALDVLMATDAAMAQTYTAEMVMYIVMADEGVDANSNGSVDPIIGEGGVQCGYLHGQLMAQYNLVATPAAEEEEEEEEAPAATPTPSPTPEAMLPVTGGGSSAPVLPILAGTFLVLAAVLVARARMGARA